LAVVAGELELVAADGGDLESTMLRRSSRPFAILPCVGNLDLAVGKEQVFTSKSREVGSCRIHNRLLPPNALALMATKALT
jgi:hypothetical protein